MPWVLLTLLGVAVLTGVIRFFYKLGEQHGEEIGWEKCVDFYGLSLTGKNKKRKNKRITQPNV